MPCVPRTRCLSAPVNGLGAMPSFGHGAQACQETNVICPKPLRLLGLQLLALREGLA